MKTLWRWTVSTGDSSMPDAFRSDLPGAVRSLAQSVAEPIRVSNLHTIAITNPEQTWYVEKGAVNVFLSELEDGKPTSLPAHLVTAVAGRLVFGCAGDVSGGNLELVMKGLPGSLVRPIPLDHLFRVDGLPATERDTRAVEIADQLDAWMQDIVKTVTRDIDAHPVATRISPGASQRFEGTVSSDRGVLWLEGEVSAAAFLGTERGIPGAVARLPLVPPGWIEMRAATRFDVHRTIEIVRGQGAHALVAEAVREFHRLAVRTFLQNQRLLLADTINEQQESAQWRTFEKHRARRELYSTAAQSPTDLTTQVSDLTLRALAIVAERSHVRLTLPDERRNGDETPSFQDVLERSGVRRRQVELRVADKWWLGDSGPLLAFRTADRKPIALIPGRGNRYWAYDPVSGMRERVFGGVASEIQEDAWMLYRTLPKRRSLDAGVRDLVAIARTGIGADCARVLVTGVAAGLLALFPALALGVVIESLVLPGDSLPFPSFAAGLAGMGVIAAALQVMRGTAMMRIEGRLSSTVGAALMDRVLSCRLNAFRRHPAGDLGLRVLTVHRVRDLISGVPMASLLTALFLSPSLVVVFAFDSSVGWLILGLGVASLALATTVASKQRESHWRLLDTIRAVLGSLFESVRGVAKLQASRAQSAAFAFWARSFNAQKNAENRMFSLMEPVGALGSALPLVAGTLVVGAFVFSDANSLSIADFLVVFAVSQLLFQAVAALFDAFRPLSALLAVPRGMRPILSAEPEPAKLPCTQMVLRGDFRLDRISFSYDDGPLVIESVSLRADAGEFVAIVGESGAGKTTLANVALGLEAPVSGGVYYDGQNLDRLNAASVRRQVGMVVPGATLQPGTILSNIAGELTDLSTDDAWRAAEIAGVEEDIKAMPMSMHTMVSENGCTLSGGQRQRIALAAMIAHNPRIMILDEAMCWLDCVTQDVAMKNIEAMSATRIVIAHRLSTVRNADRIYVLKQGRVVQEGTYEQLASIEGEFQELIRRQQA